MDSPRKTRRGKWRMDHASATRWERLGLATTCGVVSTLSGLLLATMLAWNPWLTGSLMGLCGSAIALTFGPRVWRIFFSPL